jgi:deoxycytidine triphosphate deaminase
MGVLADWQIKELVKIEPFADAQARPGVISYGVSSYGYDLRLGRKFKVFTNARCAIVDPKNFDPASFVDIEGDTCLIPPNSFALAETVEYLEVPRDVIGVCMGKCLTGDTRVVDADTGDYVELRDFIARRGGRTVSLGDDWKAAPAAVTGHVHSGIEPVYLLRTRCGLTVKATAQHPFRTADGWTALENLTYGDRIAVARSCPVFGKDEMPRHEATLLGLLLADGQCRTPGSSPRYTTGDPRLVEVLREAAAAFGCHVRPVGRLGYNLVSRPGRGGVPVKNKVFAWLESLGCACKSVDKKVPAAVFRATRPAVAAFLRALFSGDGSVYTSVSKKGTFGVCLEYASSSERLARDVRHLLLRFGVFSLLRERLSASGRTAYRVQVTDPDMLRLFAREIGFIPGSCKQGRLDEILTAYGPAARRRSNFDTLPPQLWPHLRRAADVAGRSLRGVGARLMLKQSVPLGWARSVAAATADPVLSALANADVVWDTVESVTPLGPEPVYDLTVPGGHNFTANDIYAHNSTYARIGIIVNVTPLEPEWKGKVTIEISNTTPLPAKVYAGEGIAQVLFLRADAPCKTSYADKAGKYQNQKGLTLPFVVGSPPPA